MEQQEPRKEFVTNFHAFCEEVELNKKFMDELKKFLDAKDQKYIGEVLKFGESAELDNSVLGILKQNKIDGQIQELIKYNEDMAKKAFIFLEFTRERSTCNEMVNILRECGQDDAADILQGYNTSPKFMRFSYGIELPIIPAIDLRSGKSKWYPMERKPRGMCIIINNVKEKLEKESLRFKNIFEQLDFFVLDFYDMSASEMKNKFIELSKDKRLTDGNALIVMTISHGHDEKVCGADGSEIRITQIIDIFYKILADKPKLFFFNCCRIHQDITATVTENPDEDEIVIVLKNPALKWRNDHKNTMVCFSCAEGYESWFIPGQFTHFGQALSHCIAQYACDNEVKSIMTLTSERYKEHGSAEIRYFGMGRKFYFNPGLPIDKADK